MKRIAIGVLALVLVLGVGALWLAHARLMPPPHTVQQTIPDARIPH
ncbi:MAG TPA: hypothetical protein VMV79_00525 [Alphaproteobacteria bacterium]|nr:hypothetical protein [Alphaproteobacteria bacterium]